MKKIINIVLLAIWMIVIFAFSNQESVESKKLSETVIEKTVESASSVVNKEVSEKKMDSIIEKSIVLVRKSAHFIEYLILGLLMINALKDYVSFDRRLIIISISLCILYSITDEIHQLYVLGRSGEVKDTIIDTLGSILGISIYSLIYFIIKRRRLKKANNYDKILVEIK